MAREGSLVVNWHPIILLLLSLAVVVGCVDDDDNDYKLEVTETRTWPASGISEIAATTENGNISVSATQDTVITALITRRCYGRDRADAENYIDNVVVEDSVAGGQLAITAEMPDNGHNYSADFEIFAPESVHPDLVTTNGNVSAVSTVAGARLRSTNGNLTSQSLRGGVDGLTTNGNAICDLAVLTVGESAIVLITNGNATLSVPSDVSAMFDVRTTNGNVEVTGFPSVTYTTNEPTHKAGTIGTPPGTAFITIVTVNGNVTLRAR